MGGHPTDLFLQLPRALEVFRWVVGGLTGCAHVGISTTARSCIRRVNRRMLLMRNCAEACTSLMIPFRRTASDA